MFRYFIILILALSSAVSFSQIKVNSVSISGNRYFTFSNLQDMMITRKDGIFSPEQYKTDLKTIRDRYKSSGFLYAKFTEDKVDYGEDTSYVDIRLSIDEGNKVVLGQIEIEGNRSISDERILDRMATKEGDVLNDNILNEDIAELLKSYESIGLPFAKVSVEDVSIYNDNDGDKIKLRLLVTENSKVKIDKVKIKGNETTKDYVILRELDIPESKVVTSATIQNMKERLDRLDIFESVSTPKIYTSKSTNESGLLIEVKEGNTNTFDGILGYIPPSGNEDGYFTGLVNVSFRNLFGTGRKLVAKYQQEVRETQELEFKYFEPYLFSLPLDVNAAFLQRLQDTTYTRRNLDLKADFLLTEKFTISAVGNYERVIPSDIANPTFVIADSRVLSSGAELLFDSRDNIFIPQKGFLYRSLYTYGSKKIYNAAQLQSLGYKDSYTIQRYFANIDFYYSFSKRQTNLLRLFAGEVKSDKLEDADYFRIGGNKFIRGYRNEQFLASRLAVSNIELRYSISRKGFLFGFFDSGYYFKPADDVNNFPEQSGFLYGYGLGIRLETGIGVIGVSYALGKDDDILDGKINFGLINDF